MATIRYTKTHFIPPSQITEETYLSFRRELQKNLGFKIDPNPETFTEKFSGQLKTIGISGGLFVLGLIIAGGNRGGKTSIWNPIIGISIAVFIISILMLLLEGPSFATYIKQKEEYFERMEYAIKNTSSYYEFVNSFYK